MYQGKSALLLYGRYRHYFTIDLVLNLKLVLYLLIIDKLILRVKEGLPVSKYKEVDYAKLKALAAEQKFKGM